MAIKGLKVRLPECGAIRIGKHVGPIKKTVKGKDYRDIEKLDHFILTTPDKNDNGDFIQDVALMDKLKKSKDAILNKDGNLVGIPGRLLYNDIDLNFFTNYQEYKGGKRACFGDGEWGQPLTTKKIKCPCGALTNDEPTCKKHGRLIFVIDASETLGACHILRTTAIESMLGSMHLLQQETGGLLAFLPLHLILTARNTIIPTTGQPTKVQNSSVIFRGTIEQLQNKALEMARAKAKYFVTMDEIELNAKNQIEFDDESPSEEEQRQISGEFYSDRGKDETTKKQEGPKKEKESPASEATVDVKPEVEASPEEFTVAWVTNPQKKIIVRFKNKLKITNPDDWAALIKPFEVSSCNQFTENQANEFISILEKKAGDDIPF